MGSIDIIKPLSTVQSRAVLTYQQHQEKNSRERRKLEYATSVQPPCFIFIQYKVIQRACFKNLQVEASCPHYLVMLPKLKLADLVIKATNYFEGWASEHNFI